MEIADLITPSRVVAQLRATNKKQALQELAKRAAVMTGIQERMIYDVLIERERLGSTGRDRTVCEKLRGTDNADALYALLIDRTPSQAT